MKQSLGQRSASVSHTLACPGRHLVQGIAMIFKGILLLTENSSPQAN